MKEGAGKKNPEGKAGTKNPQGSGKRPSLPLHGNYPLASGSGTQTSENPKKNQPRTMRYR